MYTTVTYFIWVYCNWGFIKNTQSCLGFLLADSNFLLNEQYYKMSICEGYFCLPDHEWFKYNGGKTLPPLKMTESFSCGHATEVSFHTLSSHSYNKIILFPRSCKSWPQFLKVFSLCVNLVRPWDLFIMGPHIIFILNKCHQAEAYNSLHSSSNSWCLKHVTTKL